MIYAFIDQCDGTVYDLDELIELIYNSEEEIIRVWINQPDGFWQGNLQVCWYEDHISFNANKGYDYTSQHNLTACESPCSREKVSFTLAGTLYNLFWRDK